MGSIIEINDTLQINKEQGFPKELSYEEHATNPISANQFQDKIFKFSDKSGIRVYKAPPVRNFLVENRDGKWLYWGLIHITSITHDYQNQKTSGEFKIIYINTPEEMVQAHKLIDQNPDTSFFENK